MKALQQQSTRTRELESEYRRLRAMGSQQAENYMLDLPEERRDLLMKYIRMAELRKRYEYMQKVRRSRVHTASDYNQLLHEIERLEAEIEED